MKKARIRLPVDALLAVRVGCGVGDLGPLLRHSAVRQSLAGIVITRFLEKILLFFLFAYIALVTLSFFMTSLYPTFLDMFDFFNEPLPSWSSTVYDAITGAAPYWLALYTISLLIFLPLLLSYMGWTSLSVPLFRRIMLRADSATILTTLSLLVQHGHNMVAALRFMSWQYPRWTIRRRLRKAVRTIDAGGDWCDGLKASGLLNRREAAVLRSAQRAGNLSWALQEIAQGSLQRLARRLRAIGDILAPIGVVLAGLFVLAWSGALFAAFARLITLQY